MRILKSPRYEYRFIADYGLTCTLEPDIHSRTTPRSLFTVVGVQFKLDGENLGAEVTRQPYSVPWNTIASNNGSHTLTAVARGLLGIRATSTPVTVMVFNDTIPPTVTITSPASGSPVG